MAKKTEKQSYHDWEKFYLNFVAEVSADQNETIEEQKARIKKLESNFEEWKKYYFPNYCYAPAAPFHKKSSKRILENGEWYESRVWARELAKDAVCMMESINQALRKLKNNFLLISNSWDKAADLLEPYRITFEKNERIINDYGVQQLVGSWAYGDFVTTGGASFLAVGAGQSPRGSRKEEVRPDKIIISDIDTDEDVLNEEIINKRWQWFEKAVFPTRSVSKEFQVIWLGNLIAKDCCVARAMKKADYVDVVNLEDEDGNSTWAEKNSIENIARIKSKISTAAFQAEYMNNPLTEGSVFKEMTWGKVPPLHTFPFLINYSDPSPSNNTKSKANSNKSSFLLGLLGGRLYVITGYLDRVTNAEFVDWFYNIDKYVNGRNQVFNYIENNSLQDPFYQQVFIPLFEDARKKYNKIVNITPDTRKKPEKYVRVEGNLEPLNRTNNLILNEAEKGNPHMIRLAEQFLLVSPKAVVGDGPDCIEGGYFLANMRNSQLATDSIIHVQPTKNSKRI